MFKIGNSGSSASHCSLVNVRFVKPFDREAIRELSAYSKLIVTMEENVITGGFGQQVLEYVNDTNIDCRVMCVAVPDRFIEHGSVDELKKDAGIDAKNVTRRIMDMYAGLD